MRKRLITALLVAVIATLGAAGASSAAPGFEFKLGFRLLADRIPGIAGEPLENEHFNPANGDSLQQTTWGLMVWRKADNWTAFTNGARTWVNGPFGVQERGNEERFDWETRSARFAALENLAPSSLDLAAEQAALEMINRSRQENGLGPVAMDEALRQVARAHARDMSARSYFAHANPEGQSPFDRMRAASIAFRWAAENLGSSRGYGSPTNGVRMNHNNMMAEVPPEDGHRVNILNPNLRKVGIGVCTGADGKTYYVSDFTG